ncbi:hypothetical protein GLYMA_08G210850v4 [Glycine max]|nr:hypothetical protein GLYMA_08G210850v4 [Glycine max]KAH1052314.1 hypothetical protein GYH30_021922 [Glycine max]
MKLIFFAFSMVSFPLDFLYSTISSIYKHMVEIQVPHIYQIYHTNTIYKYGVDY